MKKVSAKNFFTVRNWLVLAMMLTVFPISAQNSASQTDLKEFERVDICTRNPKYAIHVSTLLWYGRVNQKVGAGTLLRKEILPPP